MGLKINNSLGHVDHDIPPLINALITVLTPPLSAISGFSIVVCLRKYAVHCPKVATK